MHLIVCGMTHFCVCRVLEHLVFTVFCGRATLLRPNYFFGEEGFASETSIQQGDPIGPVIFALLVDEAARGVHSEFKVWYLDDTTLGDSRERVHNDLVVLL